MSLVSNYIVEVGYGELEREDEELIKGLNECLSEYTGYEFRESIPLIHKAYDFYMGSKVLESDSFVYALNYVHHSQFLEAVRLALHNLDWKGGIQVLYKGQEDEFWSEIYREESSG